MTDHIGDANKKANIIKAAQEAGFANQYPTAPMLAMFERFYAIAFRQGMERAAEIAIDLVAFHGGSVEIEAAIRAHVQNQPKNVHDTAVMYKK